MHFYVIYLNVRRDNITLELEELSQLWIGWVGCDLDLVIDRLWAQTWLRTKVHFILPNFLLVWIWRV